MKPLIICIVGPSGSGKTSLSLYLKKELNIPYLISFTTRLKRLDETEGVEHYFVSHRQMPMRCQMLAYTKFGGQHYWTDLRQVTADVMSYVIDEKGLLQLQRDHSNEFDFLSVYIDRDEEDLIELVGKERVDRDKERLKIPEEKYSLVIKNDYDNVDSFLYMGAYLIDKAIQNLWQQKTRNQ